MVSNSRDLDATAVYYYNGQQIIETRDGSGTMVSQVYHGTQYIDEVVGLRLPDGRAYVHQDANYNVIGLTDLTGRVLERYYYSPYGELEVAFDAHFFDYNDDGDVDAEDLAAATSGGECWGDYSGDCRRLDADSDRDIDAADYTAISNFLDELSGDQEIQRTPAPTRSQLGNPFAHQGLVFDPEIGSYQNRARPYNPRLKRFMQRDPLLIRPHAGSGYQDGMNAQEFARSNPMSYRDPHGRRCRVYYKCILTGTSTSKVVLKHCEYTCVEDTTKPRRPIGGGTVDCEHPDIPKTITASNTTCRICTCEPTMDTMKYWDDIPWSPTNCSRAQCRKDVQNLPNPCKCLKGAAKTACEATRNALILELLIACDACRDP